MKLKKDIDTIQNKIGSIREELENKRVLVKMLESEKSCMNNTVNRVTKVTMLKKSF